MANNSMRQSLPPLSSLNLPMLPVHGMGDRRSSSPESDGMKPLSRAVHPKSKSWHRSRQLSVSSSCTDVSDRSTSPDHSDLERNFPARPNVKYLRVHRVQDAHFMVLQFPPTSASNNQRRVKLVFGAELHRMLSKPPNVPSGTVILPYRVIPLTGPNAGIPPHLLRRPSTSSQESSS